jgi:hypothetical protein
MLKKLISVILIGAGAIGASAAVLRGSISDASGQPLPDATVRVLASSDSSYVAGVTTNSRGRYTVSGIKRGNYIVQASYIGYTTQCHNAKVASATDTVAVKAFKLSESTIMLKEATALGIATPIKVMEDTIQYNADSYTTPPNATVGELFKRLPGVTVGSDGSITAQGQKVTKILVDGKEFFSDDPAVASKNIPVAMVDKAQVINRKSDLARMTGVDDGEDETVINLTVKKGMNNGWFGNVEVGYGTDNRYGGNLFLNHFRDGNQFTLIGNANNTNNEGFTDSNASRFRRFGGSSGVNTTQSVGANFNVGNEEIFRLGGNVFYSHNDRDSESKSNRQNILQDATTTEYSESSSNDRGHNVRGDFRLQWKPDSFNTVDFRPTFSLNFNNSSSASWSRNYNDTGAKITNSRNINSSDGHGYDISGRFIYNHSFRSHRGRSFSVSANYTLSNTWENQTAWSRNAFWLSNQNAEQEDSLYENYQRIKYHTWSNTVGGRLSWTEPIGDVKKGNYIEVSYNMSYRWNNADKIVRNDPREIPAISDSLRQRLEDLYWMTMSFEDRLSGVSDLDMIIDSINSQQYRYDYFDQSIRLGYKKVNKNYTINAGISFNPQMSRSIELINSDKSIPTRWVWNYAPFLWMRYKFSKQTSLNMNYNGRSSQPSLSQLQRVEDSSDPLNVVQGNPDLSPSFTHNLRLRYQTFNMDSQQSIMVQLSANATQNAIVNKMTYNSVTGGRYTTYENVNGNWSADLRTMYSRPLPNKLFTFDNTLNFSASQSKGYTNGLKNTASVYNIDESFSLNFRPTNLELSIRPNYGLRLTQNSIQSQNNRTIHSYGGSFNGTWYTPFGLVIASDVNYTATSGYGEGYDYNQWKWNASLSYMFLRGQNATVSIKAYDILNQNKQWSRSESAQAITDSWQNSLGRYVLATFAYKFTTFPNQERQMDPNGMGPDGGPDGGPGRGERPQMMPGGGPGGPGGFGGGPGGGGPM